MAAQSKLRIMLCSKAWVGHRKEIVPSIFYDFYLIFFYILPMIINYYIRTNLKDLCIDKNIIRYQKERTGTKEKFAENYYRTYFSQFMQCN